MTSPAVLEVDNLRTYFHTDEGVVKAVDDISFNLQLGRTLGIVGESGSGKSVTSLSIMRLLASSARIESGRIALLGRDLVGLPEKQLQAIRGRDIKVGHRDALIGELPFCTSVHFHAPYVLGAGSDGFFPGFSLKINDRSGQDGFRLRDKPGYGPGWYFLLLNPGDRRGDFFTRYPALVLAIRKRAGR